MKCCSDIYHQHYHTSNLDSCITIKELLCRYKPSTWQTADILELDVVCSWVKYKVKQICYNYGQIYALNQ